MKTDQSENHRVIGAQSAGHKSSARPRRHRRFQSGIAILLAIISLSSCLSTAGFQISLSEENSDLIQSIEEDPQQKDGSPGNDEYQQKTQDMLRIETSPADARIFVNGRYVGQSPLEIALDGFDGSGTWEISAQREGYYPQILFIQPLPADRKISMTLSPIIGYLSMSRSDLPEEVYVDEMLVNVDELPESSGLVQLPLQIGLRRLRMRRFGYEDVYQTVMIHENLVTGLVIEWVPAAFELTSLTLSPRLYSPLSAGSAGVLRLSWEASAPGSAEIQLVDGGGRLIATLATPAIDRRRGNLSLRTGNVPDGDYALLVRAAGNDGRTSDLVLDFRQQRSATVYPRLSGSSGSTGLLLTPTGDLLPPGTMQLGLGGEFSGSEGGFRLPLGGQMRLGLWEGGEISFWGGGIVRELLPASSLQGGAALRTRLIQQGNISLLASLSARGRKFVSSGGMSSLDHEAAFPGLYLGLQSQLRLSAVGVYGAADLAFGRQRPDEPYDPMANMLSSWLYFRAGVSGEFRTFSLGLSAALRSRPLSGSTSGAGTGGFLEPRFWLSPELILRTAGGTISYSIYGRVLADYPPASLNDIIAYGGLGIILHP